MSLDINLAILRSFSEVKKWILTEWWGCVSNTVGNHAIVEEPDGLVRYTVALLLSKSQEDPEVLFVGTVTTPRALTDL